MKKFERELQNKLNNALEELTPNSPSEKILQTQIERRVKPVKTRTPLLKRVMAVVMSMALVLAVALPVTLTNLPKNTTAEGDFTCYILAVEGDEDASFRIVTDKNDKIVSIAPSNGLSEEILKNDDVSVLDGSDVSDGMCVLLDKMKNQGYLTPESVDKTISLSVTNDKALFAKDKIEKVGASIQDYITRENLGVTFSSSTKTVDDLAEDLGIEKPAPTLDDIKDKVMEGNIFNKKKGK